VIVRPLDEYLQVDHSPRATAVELSTGELITSDTPALDVFGRYHIAEPSEDVVGLYARGNGLQTSLSLQ